MKKVIILTLTLIMITSLLVYASPLDSNTYYVQTSSGEYWTSPTPFVIKTTDLKARSTSSVKRYTSSGTLIITLSPNTILFTGSSISTSSHDIYKDDSSVFFSLPTPFTQGMEGAQQNLLSQSLLILPIILGMLVLVIGFRKAWEMLFRVLVRA